MCSSDLLWQPTFIMEHPTEISPLARANDARPEVTERFELYITGREMANSFSKLNNAEDQAARFQQQASAKDAGDDEAMYYDADYVRALEYGMPPTGGIGVGINRTMILLTGYARAAGAGGGAGLGQRVSAIYGESKINKKNKKKFAKIKKICYDRDRKSVV